MASKIQINLPNGLKMPAVGYGTFERRSTFLKSPHTEQDEADIIKSKALDDVLEKALNLALEAGYRHIDTATLYNNEKIIGKVVNEWLTSGKIKREELFLTTKLPPIGMRASDVPKFLKASLEMLQVDYLDLYLIHCPFGVNNVDGSQVPLLPDGNCDFDMATDLVAVWKAMEEQADAGLAKSIGISNFNIRQIQLILDNARIKPANHQFEFHGYYQPNEIIDFCKKNNISMTSYSTLACPGYAAFMAKFGKIVNVPDLMDNPVVKAIAEKHGRSTAQVLLRNVLQKGIAVIPKSVTPQRIQSNIDVFDFQLDDDDVKKLEGLNQGPKAKIVDFKLFTGVEKHPEYPL